jgi:mono/diheme cytochrome c family protein
VEENEISQANLGMAGGPPQHHLAWMGCRLGSGDFLVHKDAARTDADVSTIHDNVDRTRKKGRLLKELPFFGVVSVAMAASSASGQPLTGDIAQGQELARRVCSACHRVEKTPEATIFLPGPAFKTIADTPSTTAISLRVFLRTPHKNMPNLILTENETDDVVSYILSLK